MTRREADMDIRLHDPRNTAVNSLCTFLHYAMPDVIRSRPARFVLKTSILGTMIVENIRTFVPLDNPTLHESATPKTQAESPAHTDSATNISSAEAGKTESDVADAASTAASSSASANSAASTETATGDTVLHDTMHGPTVRRIGKAIEAHPRAAMGALAAMTVGSIGLLCATESGIFRRGERRRRAGIRGAHSRQALLAVGLTVAADLLVN
ncbi:hypothetical protein [Trueperella sp. LYQ143]|uniref:hypothetical protein n=1 Tax=Trueperella sp. LYQ143 TaxID=3391059 RepID=UPI003983A59B